MILNGGNRLSHYCVVEQQVSIRPLICTWTNTDLVPPPSLSSSIFPHRLISLLLQSTDEDKTFTTAKDAVSIQVFKIQSNVQGIQRLVDKLGAQGDGPALRTSLYVCPMPIIHISTDFGHPQSLWAQLTCRHNLTEATREMVKKSTDDVKNLASFPAGGPHV